MENTLFDPYGGYSFLDSIRETILSNSYQPISGENLYSWIFGFNDPDGERLGHYIQVDETEAYNSTPNPIAYCKQNPDDKNGRFYILLQKNFHDFYSKIKDCHFAILNGLTYFGRRNLSENAGNLHAMIFDIDDTSPENVQAFFSGVAFDVYPQPSAVVLSGGGLHLYYVFETPVKLWPETKIYCKSLKYELTELMWNRYTSNQQTRQHQGINQGFRVPDGKTSKYGDFRLQAFRSGHLKVWTLEELSKYIDVKKLPEDAAIRKKESKLTLQQAKELYPDWYEKIMDRKAHPEKYVSENVPTSTRPHFYYNRAVYDWWKKTIKANCIVGNRYKCTLFLAVFAQKCAYNKLKNPNGVTEEEFIADADYFQKMFNALGGGDNGRYPFTIEDCSAAKEAYDPKYITYPRKSIEAFSGIKIVPMNKRREVPMSRAENLVLARMEQEHKYKTLKKEWRYVKPSKRDVILSWRKEHPDGLKYTCSKELGVSRTTIDKYWDEFSIDSEGGK